MYRIALFLAFFALLGCSQKEVKSPGVPDCVIGRNKALRMIHERKDTLSIDTKMLLACTSELGPMAENTLFKVRGAMELQLATQEAKELEYIRALARIGNPKSIPVLALVMSMTPSERVRAELAHAMGTIGGPAAVTAIRQQLLIETSPEVRQALMEALKATQAIEPDVKSPRAVAF